MLDAATLIGDRLRVSPVNEYNGTAVFAIKQAMQAGFETQFRFQISETGGPVDPAGKPGADGFALIIQNQSATARGPLIGYIPYSIPNAFVVEFDTWQNQNFSDPNGNHISLQPVGAVPDLTTEYRHSSSLGFTTDIPDLSDGNVHEVRISYAPGVLRAFLDDLLTPVLTAAIDLTDVNGTNRLDENGMAWIGPLSYSRPPILTAAKLNLSYDYSDRIGCR